MMNTIFQAEVMEGWLSVYMDDIAIHTKPQDRETETQHVARHRQHVHQVLNILEANDLYLKPEKCEFEQEEIDYLGVIVTNQGIGLWRTDTEPPCYKGNKHRTRPFDFPTGLGARRTAGNSRGHSLVQSPECGNEFNQAWESCTMTGWSGDHITQEKWYDFQGN